MSAVEWGIVAIVCAGALVGLLRGAIRGLIDLFALALGVASAAYAIPWIDRQAVGFGLDSRVGLIVIAGLLIGVVGSVSGLVLRVVAAPLGLARAIPPFGWFDRLAGIIPGVVKGSIAAIVVVAAVLVQFPTTAIGEEIRSTELGDRVALAGSVGYERAMSWTGQDLLALARRNVTPGQRWSGPTALPSGNLRPDVGMEDAFEDLLNAAREREGLPALRSDDELIEIAREHALDARGAENRRLPSTAEDVGDRMAAGGRNCLAVGAVLATGNAASDLLESLLASDQQREILLSNTYVYAGIGVVSGAGGEAILVGVFVF